MLFGRRRQRERENTTRLTAWALNESGPKGELERLFGREHAEELGPLGWLFRAIECVPHEEPPLGRWQRFERELRQRLSLLPPPTRRGAIAGFIPPLMLLPAATVEVKAAMSNALLKGATVAGATTALTFQMLSGGHLSHVKPPAPEIHVCSLAPGFENAAQMIAERMAATERLLDDAAPAPSAGARPL